MAEQAVFDDVDQGPVVSLTQVTKKFDGGVTALRGVGFDVPTGQILALLGRSGSGKSTLLRHICCLHRPTSGSLRVLGTDVAHARGHQLRQIRRRTGFVFQQFNLVGQLSVLENVCSGALGRLVGPRLGLFTYTRALRLEALEHLDRVGMADHAFQRTSTLSGGQQQRVAIARALMQHPAILLADEPVASLDPDSADTVMRLLREIARERSLTVIGSLHQVDLALGWADRVIGLRDGEVILDASTVTLDTTTVMGVYNTVPGMKPAASDVTG
ncbi:phosphonate ABC transporter ATP-binding protein [Nocardiopsis akebiae]|uniref:Phosphonate ABC transporter ATP-binding protein n=1 Tax=Nocardiopsis akebiae TaxID=2831968 RepID=A0ABX8C872_9ACTN|nr:phosphonate ABC transporter ATP-binding protein [Nocardiopsis akebiae]QUX30587.1 phosphonate ABC transporter ATP-binding protein [Nocardiopsis akebiae]